jgi:RNA polymerase sigma factor for flagellar operon FliA
VTVTGCRGLASDPKEFDRLCREHLPIVHYEVRSLSARLPGHVTADDLTSAGMAALAAAVHAFEPDRGVPFARYAARRIRGALLDELRSMDWATRSTRSRARERDAARDALAAELRREPTTAEIAARMGVDHDELDQLSRDLHQSVVLRLDALADDHASDALLPRSTATPETVLVQQEREAYLTAAVEVLPERLRAVILGCFFEDRPMRELADELGVTESRISQMRTEALRLLRDGMNAHLDPELVPDLPEGVIGRRRAAYFADIAGRASYRQRLTFQQAGRGAAYGHDERQAASY